MKASSILSLLLVCCFALLLCGCTSAKVGEATPPEGSSNAAPKGDDEQCEELIRSFFAAFEKNDYQSIYESYAPAVRGDKSFLTDEKSQADHVGILAVKSAKVKKIEQTDEPFTYDGYEELASFVESENDYRSYEVTVEQETYPSEFYQNGEWIHMVMLVREDGVWYVGRTWVEPKSFS